MNDCHLIGCDSLHETVAPTALLPLICITFRGPQPAARDSVLDFTKVDLFPIKQVLPLVRRMYVCGLCFSINS